MCLFIIALSPVFVWSSVSNLLNANDEPTEKVGYLFI